ncbi:hypothetical protein ACFE04_003143 [Oxalis oulophora]
MDKYQKVEKARKVIPMSENEIRITSQGIFRNYLNYATIVLRDRAAKEIVLKAMGQAINKAVAIAEILKRTIPNLHQDTAISSISTTDTWEPIEEGLVPVEMTRYVSMISITLSTKQLNKSSPGYQAPLFVENHQMPQYYYQQELRGPRGLYNNAFNNYGDANSYDQGSGRDSRGYYQDGYYQNGNYQGGYYQNGNYQGGNYQNGNYQGGNYQSRNYQGGNDQNGNDQNRNDQNPNYQEVVAKAEVVAMMGTIKVETIKIETIKMETIKVETIKIETIKIMSSTQNGTEVVAEAEVVAMMGTIKVLETLEAEVERAEAMSVVIAEGWVFVEGGNFGY